MKKRISLLPYVMLVIVAFIWSTNFILGKALANLPPLFLGTARFTVAGIILVPLLFIQKKKMPLQEVLLLVVFMGITGVFLFNPLIYLGLHFTSSINATIINSLSPLNVAILSHIWLKEELSKRKIFGLVISILGIIWIATRGNINNLLMLKFNSGDLIIFAATGIWAVYTVLIKKSSAYLNPIQSTTLAILAGLCFLYPATMTENIWWPLPHLSMSIIFALIYLGLFPTVIAFFLWNTAVAKVGPTQAGLFYNLIPVFNVFLASQILHEKLTMVHIIGSLLIISGLITATIPRKTSPVDSV